MPSNKLKDILDEDWKTIQGSVYDKFVLLHQRIEGKNPSIDNSDYRWVEKKIKEMEGGIIMERQDLETANTLWKKWN